MIPDGHIPGVDVADPLAISVKDKALQGIEDKSLWEQMAEWAEQKGLYKLWEQKDELAGAAFKSALGYFLNTLAYDTATYLATGDKGQKPMFYTEGWGEYLSDAADNAAGTFLEELGQNSYLKFNLCKPSDASVHLKINLGLMRTRRPQEPRCTFSEMRENWAQELQDPDFLNKVQDMFNPWSNDLGIALTLQTGMENEISNQVNEAIRQRTEGEGFKAVTEEISKYIKSPAKTIINQQAAVWTDATRKELTYTGTLADAIDIFINTLIGKLMQKWLREGLVSDFSDNSYDWSRLSQYEYSSTGGGVAGAKARFRSLLEPEFGVRGDYNILSELTVCPDPTKAGPTNCVITENFRQAISERATVGEAIQAGYLNPEGVFGFTTADGLEPAYHEGYSYRSMLILRKFRIIPVGWEIAAQYINDHDLQTKSLIDLVACYDPDDDYTGFNDDGTEDWCEGLVDPDWVLKAPLNYCRREGPGPEIRSTRVIGKGEDSELAISRDDNYCADEQTCIKEKDDGSCEAYGYCTEERRKWNFNAKACNPIYNTCQTFRSEDGQTASYLENTLEYGICSADNAGCKDYCVDFNYALDSYDCGISTVGDKLYLDRDADECDSSNEGCHEFIRTKAGLGANLIVNSSFEEALTGIWDTSGVKESGDAYDGLNSLGLNTSINNYSYAVGPDSYSIEGETFTFSLYAKNCNGSLSLETESASLTGGDSWEFYEVSYAYPPGAWGNTVEFSIQIIDPCLIDAVKLERGKSATAYSDYRGDGLAYLKYAPDYLGCAGLAGDPPECGDFVRSCGEDEVGCDFYTAVSDGMTVPAKIGADDYCPAECGGYDTYIQSETNFDSMRDEYFIPKSARACGASAAGCDMFTNLDEVEQGGEGIEYYSYLRQCLKPEAAGANCANYYTWEGSDETGYQLRVHSLVDDGTGRPEATEPSACNTAGVCDDAIYGLPITDPDYNPDCREFYNRAGNVYYCLYSKTYSCSDDCLPFRRAEVNYDPALTSPSECGTGISCAAANADGEERCWDNTVGTGACVVCKSGGRWSTEHKACIYDAIPSQSQRCGAGSAGCREYSGNSGNNMRLIFTSDFEGSIQDWQGYSGATVELSSAALRVGGNSLYAHGGSPTEIGRIVGDQARQRSAYVVRFIAAPESGPVDLTISLTNTIDISKFNNGEPISLEANWGIYELNLSELGHEVTGAERLIISGTGNFFIDDIRLTEIRDRYYLIKNSWVLPDTCLLNMLGCEAYRDQNRETHYLYKFTRLCQESSVGCEIMIDTYNYSSDQFGTWNGGEASVPGDEFRYIVYNSEKQCNRADKGCQRLGEPYYYGQEVIYTDVYLKNDPDSYDTILCSEDAAGCGIYISDEGENYFKNPGDQVCRHRNPYGDVDLNFGWYKEPVKRCDADASGAIEPGVETRVCLTSGDCDLNISCILDINYYPCVVSEFKTFGTGRGAGGRIFQPAADAGEYWAGLCPAEQAGCSEYIDPVSRFSNNTIFNANFTQNVDANAIPDGWSGGVNAAAVQSVNIKEYSLYRLAGTGLSGSLILGCGDSLHELDPNTNLLIPIGASRQISMSAGVTRSALIYSGANSTCEIKLTSLPAVQSAGSDISVELRPAVIDYRLRREVDKVACNGVVNFEEGCVLFNERIQAGADLAALTWDADLTIKDENGASPLPGANGQSDANTILKVTPNRDCAEWLACRSFIKDEDNNNVCFDVGLCDSLDENGNCDNFLIASANNQTFGYSGATYLNINNIGDMSGYVKVRQAGMGIPAEQGYYPLAVMEQTGDTTSVMNGGFEWYGSNGYPLGWTPRGELGWNENFFKAVNNPITAQAEGVVYPREGRSFLKYSPSEVEVESEFIEIEPKTEYVLSVDMNTKNFFGDPSKDLVAGAMHIITYNKKGELTRDLSCAVYGPQAIEKCSHQPECHGCGVYLENGRDWTNLKAHFSVLDGTDRIKLTLNASWWDGFDSANPYSATNGVCLGDKNCVGNVYVDNIMIYPALKLYKNKYSDILPVVGSEVTSQQYTNWVRTRWEIDWFAPRTCRLYPQSDSLSCDYYEDSGARQRGQWGYCLEYDRYPGLENACLLWYPVDKVKGDGIEEGAGYLGRFPLYYTMEASESGVTQGVQTSDGQIELDSCSSPPPGCGQYDTSIPANNNEQGYYSIDSGGLAYFNKDWIDRIEVRSAYSKYGRTNTIILNEDNNFSAKHCFYRCNKVVPYDFDSDSSECPGCDHDCFLAARAIFENNGDFDGFDFRITDRSSGVDGEKGTVSAITFYFKLFRAQKIVQTVTPVGQNKYWSGRVYEGSDYEYACNTDIPGALSSVCTYLSDYPPFGALVPPGKSWSVIANPYEWDSKTGDNAPGNQPLYYELPNESLSEPYQPRMGQQSEKEWVKRLFAKSYGTWEWQEGWICANGDFPGGAPAMTATCEQFCIGGICDTINTPPENAPPDLSEITAAWYMNGMAHLIDAGGNYYLYNESDWTTGTLASVWGTGDHVPDNYADIKAAWVYDYNNDGVYNNNDMLTIIDSDEYFQWRDGDWFASGLLTDTWGGVDYAPPYFSRITGAFILRSGTGYMLYIMDDTYWYAYNYSDPSLPYGWLKPCVVRPDITGNDDPALCASVPSYGLVHTLSAVWSDDENAPSDNQISAIRAAYDIAGIQLFILTHDYLYRYNGGFTGKNELESLWGYITTSQCVGGFMDGVDCSGQGNDCPNSQCVSGGHYIPIQGEDWNPPENLCAGLNGERPYDCEGEECFICPGVTCDFCAIKPRIENQAVDKTEINKSGFVNLTFNSIVDSQQLPLVMYLVDWGDGEITTVSGVEMRDRPNMSNPHALYHVYSYWDLKAKDSLPATAINCENNSCTVTPSVKIKDNWGWCNNGVNNNPCPSGGYVSAPTITVRER